MGPQGLFPVGGLAQLDNPEGVSEASHDVASSSSSSSSSSTNDDDSNDSTSSSSSSIFVLARVALVNKILPNQQGRDARMEAQYEYSTLPTSLSMFGHQIVCSRSAVTMQKYSA